MSYYIVMLALIISMIWSWQMSKKYFEIKKNNKIIFSLILLFYITLYSCISISGSFFDFSWDGQAYQSGNHYSINGGMESYL